MNIDIEKIPFTCRGAYLAINRDPVNCGDGIWIRSLIRPEWGTGRAKVSDHIFRMIPTTIDGKFIAYRTECSPDSLRFVSNFGWIELVFKNIATIAVTTHNMGLVLEHDRDQAKLVNIRAAEKKFSAFVPLTYFDVEIDIASGAIKYFDQLRRIFIVCEEDAQFTIHAWHRHVAYPEQDYSYDSKQDILADYNEFKSHYEITNETDELATYLLWSGEYAKCGLLNRNATAVSKGLMNNVWSWDNCFNALALLKANKQLAMDNIMLFFDNLCEDGKMVDALNPYIKVDWFTKPPIHGFFILIMMEECPELFTVALLEDLYPKLVRWSMWWENNKGVKTGLFHYTHPFDSGWDNATCFDQCGCAYTPDLNSYMVLLYRCMAKIADMLHKQDEKRLLEEKAETLLRNMINYLYRKDRFLCLDSKEKPYETNSLIRMIPIMLGEILPKDIFEKLADELSKEQHFLTGASLATESLESIHYDFRKGDALKPNSYWRGPVWAPPVFVIVEGLLRAGYVSLAKKIKNRYLALIESDKAGIYENYDALQKTGYDDSSYLWTVSVYLRLKNTGEKTEK